MTVLIADDNNLIRNWLKIMLQQLEGPSLNILEAVDGEQAFEICIREAVDLLITDIRMPGMDGITLIKTLRTQRPEIQSAVLSSYDDFSYVRIALKCGALDYILKAEMQQEDISSLLEKAQERRVLTHNGGKTADKFTNCIHTASDAYYAFLRDADSSKALLTAFQIPENPSELMLTLMNIHELSPCSGTGNAAQICCLALQDMNLRGLAIPTESDQFLMLYDLSGHGNPDAKEHHLRLLSTLEQSLFAAKAGSLRQNVSLLLMPGDILSQKLRYAQSLMDYQCYYNCSSLPGEDAPDRIAQERHFLNKLQTMLAMKNHHQASSLLQKYVQSAHSARELPRRVRRTVTTVVQMMLTGFPGDSRPSEKVLHLDRLAQELSAAKTAELLQRHLHEFCQIYEELGYDQRPLSPAIIQAVRYCNENFAQKLTLEELASRVQLNKSYFSHIFHQEMGISFGDYLESVRIQNAQQLLRTTGSSMSEIADLVGFANQNYFTKVFKKVTGITPSQYRTAQFQTITQKGVTNQDH